jgi:hypothetical protein
VPGTTLEVIPLAGVPINGYHVHYPQQQTHSPLVDNIISQAEFKLYDGLGRALVNRGIPWGVDITIDVRQAPPDRSLGGASGRTLLKTSLHRYQQHNVILRRHMD